jgi:hypothetical protein
MELRLNFILSSPRSYLGNRLSLDGYTAKRRHIQVLAHFEETIHLINAGFWSLGVLDNSGSADSHEGMQYRRNEAARTSTAAAAGASLWTVHGPCVQINDGT